MVRPVAARWRGVPTTVCYNLQGGCGGDACGARSEHSGILVVHVAVLGAGGDTRGVSPVTNIFVWRQWRMMSACYNCVGEVFWVKFLSVLDG